MRKGYEATLIEARLEIRKELLPSQINLARDQLLKLPGWTSAACLPPRTAGPPAR